MYEILSLSLTIFILAAITTVLAVYDGKPSPVVGGITLNTVVAFAATLFRICLMVPVTECVCQLTWVRLAKGYRPLNDVFRIDLASRGHGAVFNSCRSSFMGKLALSSSSGGARQTTPTSD